MATVRESVSQQSRALSDAAAEIIAQPKVAERRYVPLTSAEAVLRYAGDFIPSWAGAISIDLLPAVLVAIMAIVHGAMRRGEDELTDADTMTAADMLKALRLHEAIAARQAAAIAQQAAVAETAVVAPETPAEPPAPTARPPLAGENVTPLTLADRKRLDP